jgi:hypothetical protein
VAEQFTNGMIKKEIDNSETATQISSRNILSQLIRIINVGIVQKMSGRHSLHMRTAHSEYNENSKVQIMDRPDIIAFNINR